MSQTQPVTSGTAAAAGDRGDARNGSRRLGVALLVIATAQLMVVLDGSARVHISTSGAVDTL